MTPLPLTASGPRPYSLTFELPLLRAATCGDAARGSTPPLGVGLAEPGVTATELGELYG